MIFVPLAFLLNKGSKSRARVTVSIPEKHGKSVDAFHVVGMAVGEKELVSGSNISLALDAVKPEYDPWQLC